MKSILSEKLLAEKEDYTILDVREQGERDYCKIEDSLWIPLRELQERFEEISKNKPLVIYCHHGIRSAFACEFLEKQGFDCINLEGGIDAWANIDTTVQKY